MPIKDYLSGALNNDSDCGSAVSCCYPFRVTAHVDAGSADPAYSNQVPYPVFVVLVETTVHPASRSMRPFGCNYLLEQESRRYRPKGFLSPSSLFGRSREEHWDTVAVYVRTLVVHLSPRFAELAPTITGDRDKEGGGVRRSASDALTLPLPLVIDSFEGVLFTLGPRSYFLA